MFRICVSFELITSGLFPLEQSQSRLPFDRPTQDSPWELPEIEPFSWGGDSGDWPMPGAYVLSPLNAGALQLPVGPYRCNSFPQTHGLFVP